MINENKINGEYTFSITNNDGIEVLCDTLGIIEQEDPIIIYTDYTLDKDNKFNLYVSKVVNKDDNFVLEKIDNYENIPEIQKALENIWEKQYESN